MTKVMLDELIVMNLFDELEGTEEFNDYIRIAIVLADGTVVVPEGI